VQHTDHVNTILVLQIKQEVFFKVLIASILTPRTGGISA